MTQILSSWRKRIRISRGCDYFSAQGEVTFAVIAIVFLGSSGLRAEEIRTTSSACSDQSYQLSPASPDPKKSRPNDEVVAVDSPQALSLSDKPDSDRAHELVHCSVARAKNAACQESLQDNIIPDRNPPCDPADRKHGSVGAQPRRRVPADELPKPLQASPVEGQKDLIDVIRPNTATR